MIPLRDHRPTRIFPIITYMLIASNILVFLLEMYLDSQGHLEWFFYNFAMIPSLIVEREQLYALVTSMFMHGGILHIFSNMLYFYIFGNNVEDSMGSGRFLIFYIVCGLCASLAHIVMDPTSEIPTLGASGAIAGVLGAYMVLYPRERIDALLGYFFVRVPAVAVLLSWFVLQFFYAVLSLGQTGQGGIAFFAHVGGFIAGMILIFIFRKRRRDRWELERTNW